MKKEQSPVYEYDQTKAQSIPLDIEKNGAKYRVVHNLTALSDTRYFQYEKEAEDFIKRIKKLNSDVYKPKHNLWLDLAESREGYKETPEWKTVTKEVDCVKAVNALLHTQIVEEEALDADGLLDDDELTAIKIKVLQSGVLMECVHYFKGISKADLDEYFAIQSDEPIVGNLASAERLTKAEKTFRLGKKVLAKIEGYANETSAPAWHLATTTDYFFNQEFARMGK